MTAAFERQGDNDTLYPIRKVPEDWRFGFPYYLSIGNGHSQAVNYEFFRIDTAHYFVKKYMGEGFIKSFGIEAVDKNRVDSLMIDIFEANSDKTHSYLAAEHWLKKEGEWTVFDTDVLGGFFWRGGYHDDKKSGIWKHMLILHKDTVVLEQVSYNDGSISSNYRDNGIRNKSLAELKKLLPGNWEIETYAGNGIGRYLKESVKWYIYWRGRTLTMSNSYLEFDKSGQFIEHTPETASRGKWNLRRTGDQIFVDVVFQNGTAWQIELLHYSDYEGLILNLNKHPQITLTN